MFAGESFQSRRSRAQPSDLKFAKLPGALAADNEITSPLPSPLNSPKLTETVLSAVLTSPGSNPYINRVVPFILEVTVKPLTSVSLVPSTLTTLYLLSFLSRTIFNSGFTTSRPVSSTIISNIRGSGVIVPPSSTTTFLPFTSVTTLIFSSLKPKKLFSPNVNPAMLSSLLIMPGAS